jgi:CRISPR-associated protein (TIGR03986 family)
VPREYFINPYTFIPLRNGGPIFSSREKPTHAWFEQGSFTGFIDCELSLITPTVIPGKQNKDSTPGTIETYLYGDNLAIPGSRIRGHLLSLMRALNASPIKHYQDRIILKRDESQRHKKGFIIKKNNELYIQEVNEEVLVASVSRKQKRALPHLNNNAEALAETPRAYNGGNPPQNIPEYDSNKDFTQGVTGNVSMQGCVNAPFKHYYCSRTGALPSSGRWVKFACWSGQDRDNLLEDIRGGVQKHDNDWHLVNLDKLDIAKQYKIENTKTVIYNQCVKEMARLTADKDYPVRAEIVEQLHPLKEEMFVYFELEGTHIKSMGRHYRYLVKKGSVKEKVDKLHELLAYSDPESQCLVEGISGWASDKDSDGMKGRLFVEMAIGPQKDNAIVELKNLRILSSQPPKSANFYLEGGGYDNPNARIRGRKFYWNDPKWKDPMWDNADLHNGTHAFENPDPNNNQSQWSSAEVIIAKPDRPVSFKFRIRCINLTEDEKNLLITSLVGFKPAITPSHDSKTNCMKPEIDLGWCHKVGHARPFMGSAIVRVCKVEEIDFEDKTWMPVSNRVSIEDLQKALSDWQSGKLTGPHIDMIKRIMNFNGAYQNTPEDARITYPLGQSTPKYQSKKITEITWNDHNNPPKTFQWFTKRSNTPLPKPEPGIDQSLKVYLD